MFMQIRFTSKYLKKSFSYIFKSYSKEYPATLKLNKLKKIFLREIITKKLILDQLLLNMVM